MMFLRVVLMALLSVVTASAKFLQILNAYGKFGADEPEEDVHIGETYSERTKRGWHDFGDGRGTQWCGWGIANGTPPMCCQGPGSNCCNII